MKSTTTGKTVRKRRIKRLVCSKLDKEIKELLRDYAVHDMLQQLKALEEGEAK